MRKIFPLIIILFSLLLCNQDYDEIVKFNITSDRNDYRISENMILELDFNIKGNYHIYSVDINKSPLAGETYIEYYDSLLLKSIDDIKEPQPITKFDKNFNKKTSYHEGEFLLEQNFELKDSIVPDNYTVEATLYAIACDPSQCVPIRKDFEFSINIVEGEPRSQFLYTRTELVSDIKKETDKGLIPFILFALGMGLFALLTPCVFPMIPITVSYFTKLGERKDENRSITPLSAAGAYALGIIVIFSLLGLLLALTLGASGAQQIAQNPWINLFIGLLFIFFLLSKSFLVYLLP